MLKMSKQEEVLQEVLGYLNAASRYLPPEEYKGVLKRLSFILSCRADSIPEKEKPTKVKKVRPKQKVKALPAPEGVTKNV